MNEFIAALYERLILRRPVIVLTILALIGLVFASGTRDFNLDASTDALLLENDKDLQAFRQLSMRYKTREFLFIAVVPPDDILSDATLERVGSLRD